MKGNIVLLIYYILISFTSEKPSNITKEIILKKIKDKGLNNTIVDLLSNYTGDAASIVLDFIPYIGNAKGLGEALAGKDLITGKNLATPERILSLIGAIPFANYFKGGKNFKNGQKFMKASQRAFKGGKVINGIKFSKASMRAFAKPNVAQKIIKAGQFVAKSTKSLSKIIRKQNRTSNK